MAKNTTLSWKQFVVSKSFAFSNELNTLVKVFPPK